MKLVQKIILFIFKMITNNNNHLIAFVGTVAIFFLSLSTCTLAACNKQDRKALLAFKDSFAGNPFYSSSPDWLSNSTNDCCSWDYVRCDSKGRVTSFSLSSDSFDPPDVSLNGSLPSVLGDLTALEELSFVDMPNLVGPIPPQLSKLKKLKRFVFDTCKLSGPVPSFLSQMPFLEVVDLRNNMLTGTIPASLGNLVNLNSLTLFANQLTGTIPSTLFSRAKKAKPFLYLSQNKLTGTIPRSFADVDFGYFYVDNNQLTGDASFLLGKNKKMDTLILDYNKFVFDLTKVEYPASLTYLTLSNNKIYGSISNQITGVPNLGTLDVSNNELCGKIPSGGYFKIFTADFFANNKCLCGTRCQHASDFHCSSIVFKIKGWKLSSS